MSDPKNENPPRVAESQEVPLRHKGEDKSTEVEKAGPAPEGNGATGKPAAFPSHN